MTCKSTVKKDCVAKGSSYPLSFGVTGVTDLTDWECYIQVNSLSTGEATTISRQVTTYNVDNSRFITSLTGVETSSLREDSEYIVAGKLINTLTGEIGQVIMELGITKGWVDLP